MRAVKFRLSLARVRSHLDRRACHLRLCQCLVDWEHVFGVVKRLWGFGKVRYRGLAKNATRAFTALALANIYLSRQRLTAQGAPVRAAMGPRGPRNRPDGPQDVA
jgi:hypothetical protein